MLSDVFCNEFLLLGVAVCRGCNAVIFFCLSRGICLLAFAPTIKFLFLELRDIEEYGRSPKGVFLYVCRNKNLVSRKNTILGHLFM